MTYNDLGKLTFIQRCRFVRHQVLAAVHARERVPLQLQDIDGCCRIAAPDGFMFQVSPTRWNLYKKGLASRLRTLDLHYLYSDLTPPEGPVLDVGAHTGEFSLLALKDGRVVYAVEPDPHALVCLRRNLSHWNTLTILDAVLWSTDCELPFYHAASTADSSLFQPRHSTLVSHIARRQCTTLDRLAEVHGIDALAFLKCDVEGAEPEVLEGGRDLLKRTACISVDTGPERKGCRTSDACTTLLRDSGFSVSTRLQGRTITYGTRST